MGTVNGEALVPGDDLFREVLGHFATGITVITAMDGDEPVGMAVNAFTSVSLDPPLVLFCAASASTTWPRIQQAGHFTVNVLDEHQEHLSRLFASKDVDRFGALEWRVSNHGPILADVHAWIDCTIEAEYVAGDHDVVIGRVHELGLTADAGPLLFYRGQYGRVQESE
ncbi:MAG: flavin reductase [Acidimicrobiia bacterium]|nr:flavin reductase [Acidimicrobiia bacterium]